MVAEKAPPPAGRFFGAHGAGETLDPIPNSKVKPSCGYNTAGFARGKIARCRNLGEPPERVVFLFTFGKVSKTDSTFGAAKSSKNRRARRQLDASAVLNRLAKELLAKHSQSI